MRTYYRGPDAFVTDDKFVWRQLQISRIALVRELRDIQRVEQSAGSRFADAFRIASGGLAAFAVAGWIAAGPLAAGVLVVLAVLAMLVAVCSRQFAGAKTYCLVASLGGARTTVYESRDVRRFEQVRRALVRSVENSRREQSDYGLAIAS
jgi:hypothetical protein